jgi:hypothetical protein
MWGDNAGSIWLYGGNGYDASGAFGNLNDLWKYDIGADTWTWVSGSNSIDQQGAFGTQSIANTSNNPGARYGTCGCYGPGNTLYLMGGVGYSDSRFGVQGDLWAIYLNASAAGAPSINSLSFTGANTLEVTFSEAVPGWAMSASNYTISGPSQGTLASQPSFVTWISGNTYRLTWNSGSRAGNQITVTIPSSLTDVTGKPFDSNNSATLLPVTLSAFQLQ